MNKEEYKSYLLSPYWRSFRAKILKIRRRCQNCGKNKNLNIHHKHYFSLYKEADEDIIVLCQDCHLRFHKKKKWVRAKRRGELMDFLAPRNPGNKLYFMSEELRDCIRCGGKHPFFEKEYKHGRFEVMACPNAKPRIRILGRAGKANKAFLKTARRKERSKFQEIESEINRRIREAKTW